MSTLMARTLTGSQIDAYHREGFLVFKQPLLLSEKLDRLESIVQEYLVEVRQKRREAHLNVPHFSDVRMFEFLTDPGVLDLMEELIGPDIAIWTSQFFCKQAESGQAIGWHSDGHYWSNYLEPIRVVSVWLAMDDVSRENGCLRLLPGTHRGASVQYEPRGKDENPFFPVRVRAEDIDESSAVDVELARGEFIVFDGCLLHGSNANRSRKRRFSLTMRYMPTTCRFFPAGRTQRRRTLRSRLGALRRKIAGRPEYQHKIYLARGVDHAGNEYAQPGAD